MWRFGFCRFHLLKAPTPIEQSLRGWRSEYRLVNMPWGVPNCIHIYHGSFEVDEGIHIQLIETHSSLRSNAQWFCAEKGCVEHYTSGRGWSSYGGLWCESLGYPRKGGRMPGSDSWFKNNRPPANYSTLRKGGPRSKINLDLTKF